MERPARVRIRKRKPCTRARRRLFGWKVRLPLATAFSLLSLAQPFEPSAHPACRLRPSAVDRRWVLLLAGAVPGRRIRVAAASPTFGRLFEGTEELSPGQTWSAPTDPTEINAKPSAPAPAAARYRQHARDDPKEADWNATELLAAGRKTVSFGQCRFRVGRRSTTKRGCRIG
jgi:hypothetical protein